MTKPVSYLIQLIAAIMITGGGVSVTCSMVHGEHCICGWLIVLLGAACLVVGSRAVS